MWAYRWEARRHLSCTLCCLCRGQMIGSIDQPKSKMWFKFTSHQSDQIPYTIQAKIPYTIYHTGFLGRSNSMYTMVQMVKNLPAMQEPRVRSLGQEDPLEEGMATHSSILTWRIPRTKEQAIVHGVAKSWTRLSNTHTHTHFIGLMGEATNLYWLYVKC